MLRPGSQPWYAIWGLCWCIFPEHALTSYGPCLSNFRLAGLVKVFCVLEIRLRTYFIHRLPLNNLFWGDVHLTSFIATTPGLLGITTGNG